MPTFTPADGRQSESLIMCAQASALTKELREKVVNFGVSFPICIPNFDIRLAQDCRNFGFW